MQTLEQAKKLRAEARLEGPFGIYWLVLLLTGDSGEGVNASLEALDLQRGTDTFFSTWMSVWSRKLVIAKALAGIRAELTASAGRTFRRSERTVLPSRHWALDPQTTKVQLERALLAIDVFPRCVFVLSVYEGVSLEDTAILLDSDRDLLRKAQRIGLRELTHNLARMQGWTSSDMGSNVVTSEMQHA